MLFSELLEQLTYGELSQHTISNNGVEIGPCDYARIGSLANAGLTDMFTRFAIREEEVVINLYEAINTYYLREKYALFSGSAEATKYIVDTAGSPFKPQVIQILRVYDNEDEELVLNDETDEEAVFTPTYDAIRVPTPVADTTMRVVYQAKHERIVLDSASDPVAVEINAPNTLLLPLATFIASRIISPMGPESLAEGNNLYLKYEQMLRQIELLGVFNRDNLVLDRVHNNGWV